MGAGNIGSATMIAMTNIDLFIDASGFTIALNNNLTCRNLYFFQGNLNIAGQTITTTADFVVFGGAYSADDGDWAFAGDSRHAYYSSSGLAYSPAGSTPAIPAAGVFTPSSHTATFADLTGAVLDVGASFYNNGANMNVGAFTLNLPAATGTAPQFNAGDAAIPGQWGTPYAAAFNMTVANVTTNDGWVSAASQVIASAENNQLVVDGGGNNLAGSGGWQFSRPQISLAATVYDDVIRVEFQDQFGTPVAIENTSDEIHSLINAAAVNVANGSAWYNGGTLKFSGTYTDPDCVTTTNGAGDRSSFYILTSGGSWNTDATGSSAGDIVDDAVPSGDDRSTDRDGVPQTAIPDLSFLKGLFRAANGKTMIRAYGASSYPRYTATADSCRPVLVGVEVGQAPVSGDPIPVPYDGRNYVQLRYSEPVNIGSAAGFTIADATAANAQSMASFAGAAERGGAMSGAAIVGYASFDSGSVSLGARTDSAPAAADDGLTASQVNGMYRAAPNAYGAHGLYLSVAGWSYGLNAQQFWPGYFAAAPVQPGGAVAVPSNAFVTDASGNAIEPTGGYPKATVSVVETSAWDVASPELGATLTLEPDFLDIVPLASSFNIDRFELHFSEPMRDSSFFYTLGNTSSVIDSLPGWEFRDIGDGVYRFGSTGFDTLITSPAFGAIANDNDDPFISMTPVPLNAAWTARSQMQFNYQKSLGLVTDAAGNLLPDYAAKFCAEKLPPKIMFTSAEIGGARIYLQFTEPVYQVVGKTTNITQADFSVSKVAAPIASVDLITPSGPVSELWLNMSAPVTTEFALDGRLALGATLMDRSGNIAEPTVIRRAIDIAIGPVSVLGASDGIHVGDETTTEGALATGALGLLRVFDGTGRLYDMDTTVFTGLNLSGSVSESTALTMYYDIAPPAASAPTIDITGRQESLGAFWLPSYLSGFNLAGNDEARIILPFMTSTNGLSRNYLVPASDPEIASGAEVGFLFRLGDLWVARGAVPGDPRQFDLWRYKVQDIKKQRGGVTVMNNVIDSAKRERAAVRIDLAEGGQVTVLVFTLDGDVVRSLHRGRLAAGTYTMTWDGSNAGGNPVARGMYFVRVVGPGIDEIRKVMVVKN